MFLFVNEEGTRNVIADSFKNLMTIFSKVKRNGFYQINIQKPNFSGKYDIIIEFAYEPLSEARFFRGYIINNPKNTIYCKFGIIPLDAPCMRSALPITDFFPDYLKSGYVPLTDDLPNTDLDDYDVLIARVNTFYSASK
jgi:hypothetical protein